MIVATFLPVVRSSAWWIRSFDFPRLQIASLGIGVFTAMGLNDSWSTLPEQVVMAVLGLSVGLQLLRIFPYTPLAPRQVDDYEQDGSSADRVRLLCANILLSNRATDRFLSAVAEAAPDLVLVVEPDRWWEEELRPLEASLPHKVSVPLDTTYGMLFYSRFRIVESEVRHLIEPAAPSIFATLSLPSGAEVRIACLHPRPPRPDKQQDSTHRDAELLLAARELDGRGRPTIVMGDFNDVAWSRSTQLFQRISGLLDPRRGRGMINTFHADHPLFRYPLDHIFHSRHFKIGALKRLSHVGSDHFPMFAELFLKDTPPRSQAAPAAGEHDRHEASAMIEKGREERANPSAT